MRPNSESRLRQSKLIVIKVFTGIFLELVASTAVDASNNTINHSTTFPTKAAASAANAAMVPEKNIAERLTELENVRAMIGEEVYNAKKQQIIADL